ncbi:peptidase [Virgisporangium aliadipatigenens]|uniref:Peptidase n=1 Tax=Virgisporangium aliadipatigenens TaxID=741659 RepID=A0A8J3YIC1_9ACTN|nr:M23 family metallopeptidase [Virgisporangium aliadipatigenens]GIJ45799.1 peptidase [Virgisporangium aliadipatigenens]
MRLLIVLSLLILVELPGLTHTGRASPVGTAVAVPVSHTSASGGAPETAPLPAADPAASVSFRRGPGGAFRWPLDGTPTVVRPFAPPPEPWLPGHRGADLAGAPGAVVRAAGAGTVTFAGNVAGVGVVSVEHPGGLRTTYQPLVVTVVAGQAVEAGAPLGTLLAGHEGCPVEACLHWGLRRGDVYLDPLALFGTARVRLLPLRRVAA